MKKFILPLIMGIGSLGVLAQNKHCFTDEAMKVWFKTHPEMQKEYLRLQEEAAAQDKIDYTNAYKKNGNKTAAVAAYTIPVVFHVLHLGGSENISDAQIKDAVKVMTRDYRKQNADTTNIIAAFKPLAADINFEFQLATKDPSGNCTTGITRHFTAGTDWTGNPGEFFNTWPSNQYLNIYVVRSINTGQNAAAYTFLPGSVGGGMDAIVSLHDYVGSIGTSSPFRARTLTHEAGHWFNLAHVWGGTNQPGISCGNDGVTDTPITKGYSYCPGSAAAAAICNPTITENYQNYMEYSYCDIMFTQGQSARMTTCINNTVMGRNNL